MDIHKIKLLYHTVRYLKPKQVYYRLYYFFRKRIFFLNAVQRPLPVFKLIKWENKLNYPLTYLHKDKSFTFLNITHQFSDQIDWNYNGHGKLWTYNLNYFDFLNQEGMSKNIGIYLLNDYIKNNKILKDGKEPYPISLRGINWVKFLTENSIKDTLIEKALYNDFRTLFNNIEYHLLGNHLLENAFSLLFGAYYFQDKKFYHKSKQILISELKEQILNDGGHFELSPMYHQIILFRVLDCIQLIKLNSWKNDELLNFLKVIGSKMTSWLNQVTFNNGNIPCVNDSTFNIAPTSKELIKYAVLVGVTINKIILSDSGYRKFKNNKFELFVDVGNIGPSYQLGHAHSDTLSFILHVNNKPVFVDTGVSTYEKNEKRQTERQTSAHNTVVINNEDQSQVWGGFRVAKRARVKNLKEGFDFVQAEHDGYKKLGVSHIRKFSIDKSLVQIKDTFINDSNYNQTAYFHLHPSLKNLIINKHSITIENNIILNFEGKNLIIRKESYEYAEGFNKIKKAIVITVKFENNLETTIKL